MTQRRRVNKPAVFTPISGPNQELARKLRYEIGWDESDRPYQSLRMAGASTRLNHITIYTIVSGVTVNHQTLIKVAETFGWDMNETLKLGGYDPISPSIPSPVHGDEQSVREFVAKAFPTFSDEGQQQVVEVILKHMKE
ncbi:MAG: hypothetical protein ABIY70_19820 [Capsulimonas sp.]|uniref:hypothetical protein n=1 Tax=Capsulimonas sp. TaxID=2494211 RepID=UPI00326664EE